MYLRSASCPKYRRNHAIADNAFSIFDVSIIRIRAWR